MDEQQKHDDLSDAERRAAEAREHWRKAREELRAAFRSAREERRRAEGTGAKEDRERQTEVDETMEEIAEAARQFAREVSDEARRFGQGIWQSARQEWQENWRDQWEKSFGKGRHGHWVFGGRRFRHWGEGGEDTNPFVAAFLSRGGGLLGLYVLHLLAERPRHGNEIMRQIEGRTMGSWASNPGAIYPLLSSMEENGLVVSRWEDPDKRTRRIYQITDEGQKELARLRRVLRPKVMEAIEVLHVLHDDLYGEGDQTPPTGESGIGGEGQGTTTPPSGDATPPPQPPETEYDSRLTAEEPQQPQTGRRPGFFGRLFGGGFDGNAQTSTSGA